MSKSAAGILGIGFAIWAEIWYNMGYENVYEIFVGLRGSLGGCWWGRFCRGGGFEVFGEGAGARGEG